MKDLRIGMIGYGFMGRAHSNAYAKVNHFFDLPYRAVLKAAWIDVDVVQCGYCQSGQLMAAAALLRQIPKPTDADIDAAKLRREHFPQLGFEFFAVASLGHASTFSVKRSGHQRTTSTRRRSRRAAPRLPRWARRGGLAPGGIER